jgi:hypothetical protein
MKYSFLLLFLLASSYSQIQVITSHFNEIIIQMLHNDGEFASKIYPK